MPQSVLTDQQLLKLISAKSRAGAEALYDRYAKVLRLAIFRIVQEKELTDTLLEKTIIKYGTPPTSITSRITFINLDVRDHQNAFKGI